jgi:hypothetical protein
MYSMAHLLLFGNVEDFYIQVSTWKSTLYYEQMRLSMEELGDKVNIPTCPDLRPLA